LFFGFADSSKFGNLRLVQDIHLKAKHLREGHIMHRFFIINSFLLFAVLACLVQENLAEDFRIENRVYFEGNKEPDSHSLTLFHKGVVYDFMSDPSEMTVFDKASGRFNILNLTNHVQTELSLANIETFVNNLKQLANKQKDPLIKFCADPKFEERFDAPNEELTLSSPWATYRIITKAAKNPDVSAQYREFSDWYSRLNSMLTPGSRPPQARLQVNEVLARREILAKEVNLTMTTLKNNALQKTTLRSEHDYQPDLTSSDLDQIQQAQDAMKKFKIVPYEKYRKDRKST
jgi:hypothetical protein